MAGIGLAAAGPANAQATVAAIKQRGALNCGVDTGIPGFAYQDKAGKWIGFDIDYCRAIAAAVLGDPEKVKYTPTTAKVRFTVLQNGEIDVLIRDSTMTYTRNWELKLGENVVTFYTGQAFLVKKSLNAKAVKDLDGATICMVTGATLELNIADYARSHNVKIGSLLFDRVEEAFAATESGRCDGYTDDGGSVAAARSTMKNPKDWDIVDEVISKEPLGIHTRQGDENWSNFTRWLHFALLTAEENGISKASADQMAKTSTDPFVRRLLGEEGDFGKMLGLDNAWALRAIKVAGNYGEIYEEHFGAKGLGLPRGLNRLWDKGGLQYAWPFR
ncbi:MAG: amino acid ABC transporter substrate-binding protein [Proteobacteria bacterium]|nr:amino acid ABC transporter substrate-binding protein [Pseudomonadota bacterium]MBI3497711.1 amino acid ABC transporter substrate-binding protein [Pseudomonadota bacterium]